MIYDFLPTAPGPHTIPGIKNYDSGEYELSKHSIEHGLLGKSLIQNSRGYPSVVISRARIPFINQGHIEEFTVTGPFLAEIDQDWTSFGNVIGGHLEIFLAAPRNQLIFSPHPMCPVDAVLTEFSVQ